MIKNYSENPLYLGRSGNENTVTVGKTFLQRLSTFIEHAGKTYGCADFLIDEEWEYLLHATKELLEYQKGTTANKEEVNYFLNIYKDKFKVPCQEK
jgi:hypothetical protein